MQPVWDVSWVQKKPKNEMTVVSISSDGGILEWTTQRTLSLGTLTILKRVNFDHTALTRNAVGEQIWKKLTV